jgi:hypothetical protein
MRTDLCLAELGKQLDAPLIGIADVLLLKSVIVLSMIAQATTKASSHSAC